MNQNYDLDHNLVKGCSLCEIFLNPEKNIKTKLYYPEVDNISTSEFVIVDCLSCNSQCVYIRDHVSDISNELWGKVLYKCRMIFGNNIRLQKETKIVLDHWSAHITHLTKYR